MPPLLWLGTVYLGTLFALLMQSFYSIDEFTAQIVRTPTLATYKQLVTQPANLDIVFRTLTMAVCVTIAAAIIALPDRELHGSLRVARARRRVFYVAVLRADVDQLSGEGLRVAAHSREGRHPQLVVPGHRRAGGCSMPCCSCRPSAGLRCRSSYLGMFIVFVYMWLPYMILPIAAALERVPASLLQASADLGARPARRFAR